jgi:hypothetical protein
MHRLAVAVRPHPEFDKPLPVDVEVHPVVVRVHPVIDNVDPVHVEVHPDIDKAILVHVEVRPVDVEAHPDIDKAVLVNVEAHPDIDKAILVNVEVRPVAVEVRPDIDKVILVHVEVQPVVDRIEGFLLQRSELFFGGLCTFGGLKRLMHSRNIMTSANIRSALRRNAKISRRGGVRSCGSGRTRQERWIRPFRRSMRAIDSTLGLITVCRFLLKECEAFAGVRPRWAARQLQQASRRLGEASARLRRGVECLSATYDRVAVAPAEAVDATQRLIDAMTDWLYAETQIAKLSDQIEATSVMLAAYLKGGMAPPLDLDKLLTKKRAVPQRLVFRRPSPKVLSIENSRIFCLHVRRQRSARLTVAEAPKRIFRGRAPPLVSTCSL